MENKSAASSYLEEEDRTPEGLFKFFSEHSLTLEKAEYIIGTVNWGMKNWWVGEYTGFSAKKDMVWMKANNIYNGKYDEELIHKIAHNAVECLGYLKTITAKIAVLNSLTITPYLMVLAQRQAIDLVLSDQQIYITDKYYKDPTTNEPIEVQFPIVGGLTRITPTAKEYLVRQGACRVDVTPVEAANLIISFAATVDVKRDVENGTVSHLPVKAPTKITSHPNVKSGFYLNKGINKITPHILKGLKANCTKDDVYARILEFLANLQDTKDGVARLRSDFNTMDSTLPGHLGLNKLTASDLKLALESMAFNKNAYQFLQQFDCGYKRLGSVMKFLFPLSLMFEKVRTKTYKGTNTVDMMGGAGLAHVRASDMYAKTLLYDIKGNNLKEEKRFMGKYKVHQKDFYKTDDRFKPSKYCIVDVFDKSQNAYSVSRLGDCDDPGLHRSVTACMRGEIYSHMEKGVSRGQPHTYTRMILKSRLVPEQYISLYEGCYPFIICCTGSLTGEECYVYWKLGATTEELKLSFDTIIEIWVKAGTKCLRSWCSVISDKVQLLKFCIKCYQTKVDFMHRAIHLPLCNLDVYFHEKYFRDWYVPNDATPVAYGDKKFKHLMPKHVQKSMSDFDEINQGAWEAAQGKYDDFVTLKKKQVKDGEAPPPPKPEEAQREGGEEQDNDKLYSSIATRGTTEEALKAQANKTRPKIEADNEDPEGEDDAEDHFNGDVDDGGEEDLEDPGSYLDSYIGYEPLDLIHDLDYRYRYGDLYITLNDDSAIVPTMEQVGYYEVGRYIFYLTFDADGTTIRFRNEPNYKGPTDGRILPHGID